VLNPEVIMNHYSLLYALAKEMSNFSNLVNALDSPSIPGKPLAAFCAKIEALSSTLGDLK
jgi:hypothetical protein